MDYSTGPMAGWSPDDAPSTPPTTATGVATAAGQVDCDSAEALESNLRRLLDNNAQYLIPEHLSAVFSIGLGAQFETTVIERHGRDDGEENDDDVEQPRKKGGPWPRTTFDRMVVAHEAVQNQPQEKPVIQRAVARALIALISATDGFGWTIRNTTRAKDGWRFQYACHDSLQNKDRKQNRIRSRNHNPDRPPIDERRGALKTFDCRGSIAIKFNERLQRIFVTYGHSPIHRTVSSRKEKMLQSTYVQKGLKRQRQDSEEFQNIWYNSPRTRQSLPQGSTPNAADRRSSGPIFNPLDNRPGDGETSDTDAEGEDEPRGFSTQTDLPTDLPEPTEEQQNRAFAMLEANDIDQSTLTETQLRVFQLQPKDVQVESIRVLQIYPADQVAIQLKTPSTRRPRGRPRTVRAASPPDEDDVYPVRNHTSEDPEQLVVEEQTDQRQNSPEPGNAIEQAQRNIYASYAQQYENSAQGNVDGQTSAYPEPPSPPRDATPAEASTLQWQSPQSQSASPQTSGAPKVKRTRSRAGCLACKAKRMRCTQEQPACVACVKRKTTCEYPAWNADRRLKASKQLPEVAATATGNGAQASPSPQTPQPFDPSLARAALQAVQQQAVQQGIRQQAVQHSQNGQSVYDHASQNTPTPRNAASVSSRIAYTPQHAAAAAMGLSVAEDGGQDHDMHLMTLLRASLQDG